MNDKELDYELMKKYIVADIEGVREYDISEWAEEADDEDDFSKMLRPKRKYNYEKMLMAVMLYLKQTGGVEFAVLKDEQLGEWWASKVREIERAEAKANALEKLKSTMSKEELKILGIKV